jgi:tripartite-type tricarboxylate transporter receptor subunit TctC
LRAGTAVQEKKNAGEGYFPQYNNGGVAMKRIEWIILAAIVSVCIPFPPSGFCLDYPTREIEVITNMAPGSNNDLTTRIACSFSEKYVGKPLVVVNKAGGAGAKGPTFLAQAKPDGYTIGQLSQSVIGQPYLMKGVTFNYKKSFKIITQIGYSGSAFFTVKGGPYDIPLRDIVKKLKEKPESVKLGIGGKWTVPDFTRAIFEEEADVKLNNVQFPDVSSVVPAVLGGHIDLAVASPSVWANLYKAGKVKVIAVNYDQRDSRYPDVPTFKELGYTVVLPSYNWIGAPAGTPDSIVNYLAGAFKKGFAEPGFIKGYSDMYSVPEWAGPEDSLKNMEKVEGQYLKIIKKYNLKPE